MRSFEPNSHSARPRVVARAFDPHSIPIPPGPHKAISADLPLDVEIGSGVGWFALESALAEPQRQFIAIEHSQMRFAKLHRRFEDAGRPENLFPIRAHAVYWIHHHLAQRWIDRLYILYPNPYPKRAQSNKRWHEMPFFHQLIEKLRPRGELTLATNMRYYASDFHRVAENLASLETLENQAFEKHSAPLWAPRTHFEKKYLQEGQTCFNLRYKKKGEPSMAKVEVYTTTVCPYCVAAKSLLETKGVAFTEHNLTGKADELLALKERTGMRTVPQIFINGELIGGFTELAALEESKQLDAKLAL